MRFVIELKKEGMFCKRKEVLAAGEGEGDHGVLPAGSGASPVSGERKERGGG